MSIQFVSKAMFVLAINMIQGTFWDQKRSWFIMRKFFWFGIIWVLFAKIDFLGLFGTQILSLNLRVQSKKRHNEKCWIFEKFRKVPINWLVFNYSACKLVHIILTSLFSLDMMFILYWSPYKSFKKSLKIQSKIKKFNMVNLFSIT